MKKIVAKIPDNLLINKMYLFLKFLFRQRRLLSYKDPKTLTEWLQVYKLTDCYSFSEYADKISVKEYIVRAIGNDDLIPKTYWIGDNIGEAINQLHSPCIVKTSHDCSGAILYLSDEQPVIDFKAALPDTSNLLDSFHNHNRNYIKKFLKTNMASNFYLYSREGQYRGIKPRILIEEYLVSKDARPFDDYKFFCFGGVVQFIYVSFDRLGVNGRAIYTRDWVEAPFTWTKFGSESKFHRGSVSCPGSLKDMIRDVEKVATPFKFVRVDLLSNGDIYKFGELTFQHGGGFEPILPPVYDSLLLELLYVCK